MNNVNVRNLKGEGGASVIATGNTAEGVFSAIQCVTQTTLSGLSGNYDVSKGAIVGQAIPQGTTLYGNFTTIGVQSGLVVAYNKR